MTPKNFWAFISMSALIFALALGAVGCGGSSGGDVHIDQQGGGTLSLSGHYISSELLTQKANLLPTSMKSSPTDSQSHRLKIFQTLSA